MNYSNLQLLFYEKTKTNAVSMPNPTLNLYTQPAENRVASLILQADGRWQYDDGNYSDSPTATTNLISNQQDYSFANNQLSLDGVSVLTQAGIWRRLLPFDPANDLNSNSTPFTFIPLVTYGPTMDRAEFLKTAGLPQFYDLQGNSILLYPKPDNGVSVTLTAGLKIYFKRGPLVFDWTTNKFTDGTGSAASTPGFNSLYHALIPLWGAYDYWMSNDPAMATGIMAQIVRLEAALIADYSKRNRDERAVMTPNRIKFI